MNNCIENISTNHKIHLCQNTGIDNIKWDIPFKMHVVIIDQQFRFFERLTVFKYYNIVFYFPYNIAARKIKPVIQLFRIEDFLSINCLKKKQKNKD